MKGPLAVRAPDQVVYQNGDACGHGEIAYRFDVVYDPQGAENSSTNDDSERGG